MGFDLSYLTNRGFSPPFCRVKNDAGAHYAIRRDHRLREPIKVDRVLGIGHVGPLRPSNRP
ncbi:hypothetical protein DBB29_02690 [Pandoraea cepalis]|uniref:Uncharacterized protein n=1 Tax=Pandoraea cepalis TaxID=2508294 RepID=A0AAW7MIX7_9BURK|nr:hypothetical protein [Pandoraea cepalis]MDN4577031.1 hypothetical protein [Pandoraea cepalis]